MIDWDNQKKKFSLERDHWSGGSFLEEERCLEECVYLGPTNKHSTANPFEIVTFVHQRLLAEARAHSSRDESSTKN